MTIPGNLHTTAMAVMPHKDVESALDLALTMDIPFWPQLPHVSYTEDMYVQAAEHFPGILLDMENRTLRFSMEKFILEFEETMAHFNEPEYFDISKEYSVVYHRFLEMEQFFAMTQRPRGVHLCGNPDWDFLLGLDLDVLSLDIYQNGEVFSSYSESIKRFLDRGGVIVWGIVPTNFEPFEIENINTLEARLTEVWNLLANKGIDREFLISRSLISPATCCLVNPDGEKTVEKAFGVVKELSRRLQDRYGI